jgi:hypothetical protein
VHSVEGDTGEFYCKISGKPDPVIAWKKDGKKEAFVAFIYLYRLFSLKELS